MRKCPSCGLELPPHVAKCPRDGTRLGPPPNSPPTGSGPAAKADSSSHASAEEPRAALNAELSSQVRAEEPGAAANAEMSSQASADEPGPAAKAEVSSPASAEPPAPRTTAEPTSFEHLADEPVRSESSVRAWIGVLIASLVLLGVYGVLRERLNPSPNDEEPTAEADESVERGSKKKRKRSPRRTRRASDEPEIVGSDDDFVVDNREFRDLIAEGKSERAAAEAAAVVEERPPFIPPPEMYQPEGSYSPVASYVEPGARDDVVTLDLSSNGDSGGPLPESEVKKVLRVSALMPCYDPVVQKVPQMRGRVRMRFVVAPDGHVMEATITDSDLRSRTVEKCIVKKARRFRFPASSQKTRFSTHFDFSSR